MSALFAPWIALLAACGPAPEDLVSEPEAWSPPPALRDTPQRHCDTRVLLDGLVARTEVPTWSRDLRMGQPPARHDDPELRRHIALVRATAHCDTATAPHWETTMDTYQTLQYALHLAAAAPPDRADTAAAEVLEVWAVAQTRRHGSLVDLAVGQAVEWLVVDALDVLGPKVTDAAALADEVDRLWARRPDPDFSGEAWSTQRTGLGLAGCVEASRSVSAHVQAAWHSDDPAEALDALPQAERWETLVNPGVRCAAGVPAVARQVWDSEQELAERVDGLVARLR